MVTYTVEQRSAPWGQQWVVRATMQEKGLFWEVGRYADERKAHARLALLQRLMQAEVAAS